MSEIHRHRIGWSGRADAVTLVSFMPCFPGRLPMTLADDGGWFVDLHLPASARIEYRFEIRRGSDVETTLDPSNPVVATNPFGSNSVLTGSTYRPAAHRPSIAWRLTGFRVQSSALAGRRHHRLLSPIGIPDGEALPLFCLHDGSDWLRHGAVADVLGTAILAGQLPFLRVALLDPRQRDTEYVADPRHADHVVAEVLPHIDRRAHIAAQRIIGGASLGAVASWHTAWSHPGAFTGLVLQSGTFAFGRHPELPQPIRTPIRSFLTDAEADPGVTDMGVGQTCGRFESLVEGNRRAGRLFAARAASHRLEERWTGHDWGAWADTLVDGVSTALSGGPHRTVADS